MESLQATGNENVNDDVELRVFYDHSSYTNKNSTYTEVDASNPRTHSPNMSVAASTGG